MGKPSIRPGFRFKPTDDELVMCYLKNQLLGIKLDPEFIAVVNIYNFSPWDLPGSTKQISERRLLFLAFNIGKIYDILPDKSILSGVREWYFISPISKKYLSGPRMNRATETGYWKATGKDREVKYKKRIVAMRKTLVFHMGHSPKGIRTNWVMHEFRMTDKDLANLGVSQEAYVICRVFEKSGFGPKNGEQYGAPFEEKAWDDDDNDDDDEKSTVTSSMMIGVLVNTKNVSSSSMMNMAATEPGPSTITYLENEGLTVTDVPVNNDTQEVEDRNGKKVMTVPVNGNDALVNDDFMLTLGDLESLLCKSDTQVVKDPKGKNVMTDIFNKTYVTFEELLDDSAPNAFNMSNIGASADYGLDAFVLDDDFWNYFQED